MSLPSLAITVATPADRERRTSHFRGDHLGGRLPSATYMSSHASLMNIFALLYGG